MNDLLHRLSGSRPGTSAPAPAPRRGAPARRPGGVFPIGNGRAAALLAVLLLALVAPGRAAAQALTQLTQFEGNIDYVVSGATFRANSNNGNTCTVNATAAAPITVPTGATVVAAYLFWGGSGSLDNTVTLARPSGGNVNLTADDDAAATFNNGTNFPYFGAYKNITANFVGSGTYTLSNLTVTTGTPHCNSEAVAKGFAIFVVYRLASLPVKRVQIRHGLRAFQNATETVTLDNFLASNDPEAKVTFLIYEGDDDQGGEALLFNGQPFTDGLNPANNPYNSTINTRGVNNSWGFDLDTYDASAYFSPRDREATVNLQAGADMIVLQVILTSLTVSLADVTPDGLPAPEQRLPAKYSRQFRVENPSLVSDSYNLLATFTGPAGLMTIDSVTGTGVTRAAARPDSGRVTLAAGTYRDVLVWYTVNVGAPADGLIHLKARSAAFPTVPVATDTGYTQMKRVAPQLTLTKSVSPQNTLSPGTDLTYTMQTANVGDYAARGVTVTDLVPTQTAFKLGSVTQTVPTGITATPSYSLNGTAWTYAPVSGGCSAPAGYDACVRYVRWTLTGDLPAGAAASAGTFRFVARIR